MTEDKKISMAVVRRLPRYYRYLGELLQKGVGKISSRELSEKMNVTASQIRQDLNNFGGFGQQGYGYNVEYLYNSFSKRGFKLVGLFDVNPKLIGMSIHGVEVMDVDCMEQFVKENGVDIAILTMPKTRVKETAENLAKWGIKGLWNFSPVDLIVPDTVQIENVHLSHSLMTLAYMINEAEEEREKKNKSE